MTNTIRPLTAGIVGVFVGWAIDDYLTATRPHLTQHTIESALICLAIGFGVLVLEVARLRLWPVLICAVLFAYIVRDDWIWVVVLGFALAVDLARDGWLRTEKGGGAP